jgi:hypothetical protein
MRIELGFLTAIAVATAGCGSQDSGKLKVDIPADHVAAINALVPAEWKDRLVFESGTIVDKLGRTLETYRLAVPAGWSKKEGPIRGRIAPPDADAFGRSAMFGAVAELRVGSNCNGECTTKDWAAEVDTTFYKKFTDGTATGKVTKDDKRETGRTLVFERAADAGTPDGEINILTTWWKKGGSQHFICEAKLAGSAVALAPAFEKACALVSAE